MLLRDYYSIDYSKKYYPKLDFASWNKDMYSNLKNNLSFISIPKKSKDDIQKLNQKFGLYYLMGSLCSILIIYKYDKIPGLRGFQRKWPRRLIKAGIFLTQLSVLNFFYATANNNLFAKIYSDNFPNFAKYKQDGDIKHLNPDISSKNFIFLAS